MSPAKKLRITFKCGSNTTEVSGVKHEAESSRSRKRQLPDRLGSQWSKEELKQFYKAYLKYGKNWKKVAGEIHTKSVDMVWALYTANTACLSLPEDQRTLDAFVAMMTDRYNILEVGEDEQQNKDAHKLTLKPHDRSRGIPRRSMLKHSDSHCPNILQNHSTSLVNKKDYGSKLIPLADRVVVVRAKRTPRVPVQYVHGANDKGLMCSPNKDVPKSVVDSAAGLQGVELEKKYAKSIDVGMEAKCFGGRLERRETFNKDFARDGLSNAQDFGSLKRKTPGGLGCEDEFFSTALYVLADVCFSVSSAVTPLESVHTKEQKGDDNFGHKPNLLRLAPMDDEGDHSCSTKHGKDLSCNSSIIETQKIKQNSLQAKISVEEMQLVCLPKKRARLAQIPEFASLDTEQERKEMDLARSTSPTSTSTQRRDMRKISFQKEIDQNESKIYIAIRDECSKKDSLDIDQERKRMDSSRPISTSSMPTGRRDIQKMDFQEENGQNQLKTFINIGDECSNKHSLDTDQERKEVDSTKPTSPTSTSSTPIPRRVRKKMGFPKKNVQSELKTSINIGDECSNEYFLDTDQERKEMDSAKPTSTLSMPTQRRDRTKMGFPKINLQNELKGSFNIADDCSNKDSSFVDNEAADIREKVSNFLSSSLVRRWCVFEWFYSAIDYPWFAKNELQRYMKHVKLDHVTRLSSIEWGIIKGSLGTPRRLSKTFLDEERKKLEEHRESVRAHYAELRSGVREELRDDVAQPLALGQQIIARHPKTGEIHDGSILTVGRNCFMVQFKNSDLGVQSVMDFDCMPVNPKGNLPANLRNQNVMVNKSCNNHTDGNKCDASSKPPSTTLIKPIQVDPGRNLGSHVVHTIESSKQIGRRMVASTLQERASLDKIEDQIPLELISNCLASFIMIQTCADGQYPAAQSTEILEALAASLRPSCPENLPIYTEIERLMGYIKVQLAARVPVPKGVISTQVFVLNKDPTNMLHF